MSEPTPTPQTRDASTADDALLAALVDEFMARYRRGEHPSVDEYAKQYPDLADELREVLPAVLAMEQSIDVNTAAAVRTDYLGATIGRYKLLERIGEGGFGIVYMAEQQHPVRRKVALKVIKPGLDTKQVIARFEAERQALALMDHENIAKVFDAGATDTGRPYFVMELVRGVPITEFCDANQLPARDRLELFLKVCRAVQHAHTKGIIHRDLKPTNVLVTLQEGAAVPKVIDFGVAKATGQQLTEKTLFTNFAQMIGTPLYMSPEQAEMTTADVDTRADVYSLGVLLYELLTGTTPVDQQRFKSAGFDEVRRIIREEDPPPPSTRLGTLGEQARRICLLRKSDPKRLGQVVRGELDWIVMKALEKDRGRRYETANGLARDVERYLRDEPVEACPPSAAYRLRKIARRHKGALVALCAGVATLLVLVVVLAVSNRMIAAERNQKAAALREAEAQRQRAEDNFRKARTAVGAILTRPATGLYGWGAVPPAVRKPFADEAEKYYKALIQENSTDPSLRYETAVGYRSLAYLHDRWGELTEAEKLSRDSIAILEQLVKEYPNEPTYRQQLGWSSYIYAQSLRQSNLRDETHAALQRSTEQYEKLHAEHPNMPEYPVEMVIIYHGLAELLRSENNFSQAEAAYRRAAQMADVAERLGANMETNRIDVVFSRDAVIGMMLMTGRASEARTAQADLTKADPSNSIAWMNLATLQRAAGDVQSYRRTCRAMLDRFESSQDVEVVEHVLRACSLEPWPAEHMARLARLLDRFGPMTTTLPDDFRRRAVVITRGLALYRAGRFEDALAALGRAPTNPIGNRRFDAPVFAARALVQQRLGHRVPANFALMTARVTLSGKPNAAIDPPFAWRDWTQGEILLREANGPISPTTAATAPASVPTTTPVR